VIQARFTHDEAGLVLADLGTKWTAFNEVLADGIESRAPVGHPPGLSTFWVDRALERLADDDNREGCRVIVESNGTQLVREGELVVARSLYRCSPSSRCQRTSSLKCCASTVPVSAQR
jgi:hypothetical protein